MGMKRNWLAIVLVVGMSSLVSSSVVAAPTEHLPAGAQVVSLEAQPAALNLDHKYAYSQVLITAKLSDGSSLDATRMVESTVENDLASVSPSLLVRPKTDGAGKVTFSLGDKSIAVPLTVAGQTTKFQPSFVRDVMPVLSKLGCNAGTCHGSLAGKGGFKLSLRGYDPLFDHRALTDDVAGRRINRAAPDQSLMLLKPSGVIPHVGGVLTQPGEPYYETIRAWIADGLKLDLDSPRVTSIEIFPKNPIVPLPEMTQQMSVLASYSDGSVRDVTLEAFIESGNTEVAEPNKSGLITAIRRGEAPVLARFEGAYTASTLTIMGDRSGYEWQDVPVNNPVDELVDNKLKRVKSMPSELCTDAEFIRRVSLDLVGLPPTIDEVQAFVADERDAKVKRDELVDQLVGSGDYVELWTNKWSDLLQVNRKFLGEEGAFALRGWIKQAVSQNMPYDKFVYTILTASGSTLENPPAAYYKVLRTPEELMENTTQLFLGVRFNCNHCHDHPFERWTQGQYFHLAAYFAQVGRKADPAADGKTIGQTAVEGGAPLVEDIFDTGSGEVTHGGTGQPAAPKFPYELPDAVSQEASRREQLARWVTSKENQYFAKSYVNRLWGYLFGRGIIEPIDDIRAGNPPTNPELLDYLTREFVDSGFDMQHVLKLICKSRTYQLSLETNRWNEDDTINYSHAVARRLPAEVLYDTIQRVTGSQSSLPGVPVGYRATQLPDVGLSLPSGFFEVFGRPARESACECERSSGMMLGPVMTLVNGPTIADAIANPENAITKLVAAESDDAKVVNELFLRILNRPAKPEEITTGIAALHASAGEVLELQSKLNAHQKQLDEKQAAWESTQVAPTWTTLKPGAMQSSMNATFAKQADHSVLVEGSNGKGTYTVTLPVPAGPLTGLRLELLADDKLPAHGPGRATNGNLVLSELKATIAPASDASQTKPVEFGANMADFSQEGYAVAGAVDGNPGTGWAVAPEFGKNHSAVFEFKEPLNLDAPSLLVVTLDHQYDETHTIGKFRFAVSASPSPAGASSLPENIAQILAIKPEERGADLRAQVTEYHRSLDTQWVRLRDAVTSAAEQQKNVRLTGAGSCVGTDQQPCVPVQPITAAPLARAIALSHWELTIAWGVSADGHTITGTGFNPNGQTEAWIAQIPEPSSWALSIASLPAGVLLAGRFRRSARPPYRTT